VLLAMPCPTPGPGRELDFGVTLLSPCPHEETDNTDQEDLTTVERIVVRHQMTFRRETEALVFEEEVGCSLREVWRITEAWFPPGIKID
jgi:hypothetical protein